MDEKLKQIGNHLREIRVRTRIAIVSALCFIAIYALFISVNYADVPNLIPELHDTDGVLIKAFHKSAFLRYGFEFLLLFLLAVLVSRIIKPFFKMEKVYLRTRCLIFDIVNLYISTAACITMVLFAIAGGEESAELSYFSQSLIFLFWTAVMVVEYILDFRKIRKSVHHEESASNKPEKS